MIVNIIQFLHLILIMIIAISPIINNYNIKKYVFIFLVYLLFQYLTGYRKCGLTDIEYLEATATFRYSLYEIEKVE